MKAVRNLFASVAAIATIAVSGPATASPELAKAKNCVACHAPSAKLVGPSFKEIATKYAGDAGAPARLAEKIRKGSQGVWGAVPMPANPQVNDDEANALARWILAQH